jgi:predicted metalloprotease with PDZ domain
MKAIQRWGCGRAGVLLLVDAALTTANANAPETAPAAGDESLRECRFEAAPQRLEQAAEEAAELAIELGAGQTQELRIRVGEPRVMLGVQLGETGSGGVRVVGVTPGGPAADAGLKPGDGS